MMPTFWAYVTFAGLLFLALSVLTAIGTGRAIHHADEMEGTS